MWTGAGIAPPGAVDSPALYPRHAGTYRDSLIAREFRGTVKFALIDRIVELHPPERIVAVKAVSLAEEYLADHFPTFPVLPGVLMLESLAEAAAWLVRASEDFAHSMILLREAKNVTYKSFVKPGYLLRSEVTCRQLAQGGSDFTGVGSCDGKEVLKARFSLRHFNLADESKALAPIDSRIIEHVRERFTLLSES